MSKGQRLDQKLIELGLFASRQQAQAAIMDGGILVNGEKVTKAGTPVAPDAKVEVTASWQPQKFVSRGGVKLEQALSQFDINVQDRICLDIGASTGGFTDCLLQNGAKKIYAIDVGHGQIVGSLRQDSRVIVMEKTNVRDLGPDDLYKDLSDKSHKANFACVDVSFISLSKVLPSILALLDKPNFEIVALIKPQFEAEKHLVGKGGVIKSPDLHKRIIGNVLSFAEQLGLSNSGLTHSPIKGPSGNIEFLVHWQPTGNEKPIDINSVVQAAHSKL